MFTLSLSTVLTVSTISNLSSSSINFISSSTNSLSSSAVRRFLCIASSIFVLDFLNSSICPAFSCIGASVVGDSGIGWEVSVGAGPASAGGASKSYAGVEWLLSSLPRGERGGAGAPRHVRGRGDSWRPVLHDTAWNYVFFVFIFILQGKQNIILNWYKIIKCYFRLSAHIIFVSIHLI